MHGGGACPPGTGKEKNLAGDCVCPEGKVEDANGVCQDAGDGDGACPAGSGKEKNLAGDCVCPDGKVEDANGVCQDAGDRRMVPAHPGRAKRQETP